MKYYSINSPGKFVGLKEAVLRGLAADKGLYMPESLPSLPSDYFETIEKKTLAELGFETLSPFFCPDIKKERFEELVTDAFNFEIPIKHIHDNIYTLELFHGPTCAFKDIGARFMARVLSEFVKDMDKEINILVATSGDTGSAVANGFYNVPGINVFVLYPKGLVSDVQEKQFTTLGHNITSIEVEGTFDDCQRMVKEAFMDVDLNNKLTLTSANSINLARLLPQSIYYHYGYAQMKAQGHRSVTIGVPSGNFGNITAGFIASKMGLPIKRFIAATNANDVVPEYLQTGIYKPRKSVATIANAMDVGDPSNFIRIENLFGHHLDIVRKNIDTFVFDDDQIRGYVKQVFDQTGYILDPHGATGYGALKKGLAENEVGFFIETAHPAKFPEVVESIIGKKIPVPQRLQAFMKGTKQSVKINVGLDNLKQVLVK
ncbi:MAG: threonine synthase [Breznakibacter sp.]